jgi:hypothetical protein
LDANASVAGDIQSYLINYDLIINLALVRKIAAAHGPITGIVSEWYIENSARYPETTVCNTNTGVKDPGIDGPIPGFYHNFPNPFNPSTTIYYKLNQSSRVKLTIYNSIGEKIKTLYDAFQSAGEYKLSWDGTDDTGHPVSSGMYFNRLETQKTVLQKKMLLIQ